MIASYTPERRKTLHVALDFVLTPAQRTMVRELVRLEDPQGPEPKAEALLYWIRLNMPRAAARIDAFLHPRD
ncbi:MAG: hypothetical protein HY553_22080 [Elusimicrobia bacterium]|nr:hypothetical protein [Elusimicrobiota bacterium]